MKKVSAIFTTGFAVSALTLALCTPSEPGGDTTAMALIYPAGDETFSIGDTVAVTFKANGDSVVNICVQVTSDGQNYFSISKENIPIHSSGTKNYTIQWYIGHEDDYDTALLYAPHDFADDADPEWTCRIRIYAVGNENISEESGDFTVNLKRPFFLRYPIGGEKYNLTDTIPIIATYRTDSMSIIQYFFWSIQESDWSQITKLNTMMPSRDYKLVTYTKKFVPADSSSFPFPLGDSTKIRINDYNINRPMESGWITINKK